MKLQKGVSYSLLPIIALSYIWGILISALPVAFTCTTGQILILLGTNILLLLLSKKQWQKTLYILVVLLFFQIGYHAARYDQKLPSSPHHIGTLISNPQEAVIVGKVKRLYSFNGDVSRFDMLAQSMKTKSTKSRKITGAIRFTIAATLPHNILPGDTIAVRSKLKRPQRYLTTGSFDYPAYLAQHDIYITGYIRSPLHLHKVNTPISLQHKLVYLPERLRVGINRFIDSILEGDKAAIYKALLTGDRTAISQTTIDNFRNSGLLHILAISGIHMSLLGVFLFTVTFWLLRRSSTLILHTNVKKVAVVLCIFPLVFYACLAGAKAPVMRSLFMSLLVIGALCYGRKYSIAQIIAGAALVLLTFSPTAIFTPSFQLTFAAVIAISLGVSFLTRINNIIETTIPSTYTSKILQWLSAGCVVSLAATLGTAPLLILHFNHISLIGVVANLVVEPIICLWTLLIGFTAIPFVAILPPLAELLFHTGSIGIRCALHVVEWFASFPYSSFKLPTLSYYHLALYYLCWIVLFVSNNSMRIVRLGTAAVLSVVILLLFVSPAEIMKRTIKESTLTFLDVGQGSCTLIELPGGNRALIDGGAITSPGFDIGERIIAPFLYSKGIQTIDSIVITHADSDHYNGIAYILKHFKVTSLWVNQLESRNTGWQAFLKIAGSCGVKVMVPEVGTVLSGQDNASLQVIAINSEHTIAQSTNDNSIIVKYQHDDFSALFPGDITVQREKELVRSSVDMKSDVLLAAHHGSATSNSDRFLKEVTPDTLIVSSGRYWAKKFPSPLLSLRCKKLGINLLPINTHGSIAVKTKAGEYSVHTLLQ